MFTPPPKLPQPLGQGTALGSTEPLRGLVRYKELRAPATYLRPPLLPEKLPQRVLELTSRFIAEGAVPPICHGLGAGQPAIPPDSRQRLQAIRFESEQNIEQSGIRVPDWPSLLVAAPKLAQPTLVHSKIPQSKTFRDTGPNRATLRDIVAIRRKEMRMLDPKTLYVLWLYVACRRCASLQVNEVAQRVQ